MLARRFPSLGPILILVAVACAPAETPADPAADEAALNALAERETATMTAGEFDAIPEIFAADVVTMPPNEPTIRGVDALRTWASDMHEEFSVSVRYPSIENHVHGDVAYQIWEYELSATPAAGGETMTDRGRGVHVLRRQPDGSWKIVLDIWNSTEPMPGM